MKEQSKIKISVPDYPQNFPESTAGGNTEGSFLGYGGRRLYLVHYGAVAAARAVLVVAHGMSESGKRYAEFAADMSGRGVHVYVPDLRAHGRTAASRAEIGMPEDGGNLFGDSAGDITELIKQVRARHDGLPVYLLGHSYGSFVSQEVLRRGAPIDGLLLSGSAHFKSLKNAAGLPVAWAGSLIRGRRAPAKLIDKLSFKAYEKKFPDGNWLSRDGSVRERYRADDDNTHMFSMGFYSDFFRGALALYSRAGAARIDKDVRIFIFSGDSDPVGGEGRQVYRLARFYERAGVRDVRVKLYAGGRHEMLNESNRHEVYSDVAGFILN